MDPCDQESELVLVLGGAIRSKTSGTLAPCRRMDGPDAWRASLSITRAGPVMFWAQAGADTSNRTVRTKRAKRMT